MNHYKCFNSYQEQVEDAKRFKGLPLYRLFEENWQAESLLNGQIWISTLERCRSFEDDQQGDQYEGSSIYNFSLNTGNRSPTAEEIKYLAHGGVDIGPNCSNITIGKGTTVNRISNGFLLCTTNDPEKLKKQSSSWKYSVKIDLPPKKLALLLTNSMIKQGIPLSCSFSHGWAKYGSERHYNNPELEPQRLAFLKPEKHMDQSEYRFFTIATNNFNYPDDGILINCPELVPYLYRID